MNHVLAWFICFRNFWPGFTYQYNLVLSRLDDLLWRIRLAKIVITGEKTTKRAYLYEFVGRQGRQRPVPTYKATFLGSNGKLYEFAVTRDSAAVLFLRQPDQFGVGGECPPSPAGSLYRARLFNAKRNGPCLLLYEAYDDEGPFLIGDGMVKRRYVLIHAGPASSLGCMTVAGGRRGWRRFWRAVTASGNTEFLVRIEPK